MRHGFFTGTDLRSPVTRRESGLQVRCGAASWRGRQGCDWWSFGGSTERAHLVNGFLGVKPKLGAKDASNFICEGDEDDDIWTIMGGRCPGSQSASLRPRQAYIQANVAPAHLVAAYCIVGHNAKGDGVCERIGTVGSFGLSHADDLGKQLVAVCCLWWNFPMLAALSVHQSGVI
jgi:hypothetical protein